jgi:DNA-3-methyladenine glycosylase I
MPVTDDLGLYERLTLEAFQSGLSWLTILRKREGFRRAFLGFDPEAVAAFGDADVERLMAEPAIVRNRAKIQAAITNARAIAGLHATGESLAALVWSFRPPDSAPAPRSLDDLAPFTPEAKALAKALKARGFAFVGPTTAYSAMQACGLVNDHLEGCCARDRVTLAQAEAALPHR